MILTNNQLHSKKQHKETKTAIVFYLLKKKKIISSMMFQILPRNKNVEYYSLLICEDKLLKITDQ